VLLLLIVGLYLLIALLMLVFQRRLIYLPTRGPVADVGSFAAEHGFAPWKNAAGQIIGWKMPANGTATASVLVFHGNAGCGPQRDYLARPLHDAADVDVFVMEYPGYGARDGSPSKTSFDAAAEEAFQLLPADKTKFLVSESIGAGVAGELVKKHPHEIAGLTMFVPYHDLPSVAQRQFPFLPAYWLLFDRFDPAGCLKDYRGPVKFIVAGADEILGPATGEQLARGYRGPKVLQIIPGAYHNDVSEQTPEWWRDVFSFWKKNALQP
jgi:pimeloyl-ACP methyl ester carboxylesterase